jgi:hypothetical protein
MVKACVLSIVVPAAMYHSSAINDHWFADEGYWWIYDQQLLVYIFNYRSSLSHWYYNRIYCRSLPLTDWYNSRSDLISIYQLCRMPLLSSAFFTTSRLYLTFNMCISQSKNVLRIQEKLAEHLSWQKMTSSEVSLGHSYMLYVWYISILSWYR